MSINEQEKQKSLQSGKKAGELYFLFILFVLFVILLKEALKQEGILEGVSGGPGIIPQLMSGAALVMVVLLFIQLMRKHYKEGKIIEVIKSLFCREVITIIGMVVLYALLLERLHFVPTTMLFLFFSMILLDRKKTVNKLIISAGMVASIVLIFRYIFQVILP